MTFFFPVKVYYPHLRWPGGLSSVLYGLGESLTASPRVPSCVQSRGRRMGGGCSSAARLQGAGIPGSCHAALAPNLPPKSRPSPLPFATLEPGAEPPREECVNFLTGGKLSSPGMGCFPAGSAGCAWLCLYIGPTKSEGPRFLSRGPVRRASVQRKEARKISLFFSPQGIVRGAQSWVSATGYKEVPLDLGGSVMTHLERLDPPCLLRKGEMKVWQPHPTLLPGTLGGLRVGSSSWGCPKRDAD